MTQKDADAQADAHAETLAFLNTELAGRLERQSDSLDKLDTKAVLVVGYALAAVAFLATRSAELILAILTYIAYAAAAGFGLAAVAVRKYHDIEPRVLFSQYWDRSAATAAAALAVQRVEHYEFNDSRLKAKTCQWKISVAALLIGTMLMTAAILVQTYRHDHPEKAGQTAASASPRSCSPAARPGGAGHAGGSLCAIPQSGADRRRV
jgi:hypothetical protein